jgi:uncharacterized protein
MKKSRHITAVVFLFSYSMMSYATSFDCTKASTAIEKNICGNPSLGVLDEQLATTYHKAYNASSSKDELKTQQREWVKNIRNKCTNDDCLSSVYSSRIAELNEVKSLPGSNEQPSTPAVTQQTQNNIVPTQVVTSATDSIGLKTQTVIAEGVGSTVESAAQNAAENALKQVVGTFIDAKKQLDKHTEISNGIRNETKNISTNIKEYSQGTIKGFKVIDSKQESSLTRVNAEVVVRIDDFHAYIKKLAEGEVAVEEGLFVKMKTEKKQQSNQADLLYDNVISPIVNGEVVEFSVGEPKTLSEIGYKGGAEPIDQLSAQYGNTNIVAFRVSASLNKEFTQNMRKTMASISSKKTTFNSDMGRGIDWHSPLSDNEYSGMSPLEDGYNYSNDVVLILHDGEHVFANTPKDGLTLEQTRLNEHLLFEAYLFSGSKQELSNKATWLPAALSDYQSHLPTTNVEIALTGSAGELLQKEMFGKVSTGKLIIAKGDYGPNFETPWSLIGLVGKGGGVADLMIWEKRSFLAFIAINPDALAKTKKIKVKLVN